MVVRMFNAARGMALASLPAGLSPEEMSVGYSSGSMVNRCQLETAMLCYGINNIRLFCENDVRFLKQF